MAVRLLDDFRDESLSDYRNVPDPELVARRGLFVAEGRLVVRRLLASGTLTTRSVMVTESAYASLRDQLDARPDVPVYLVPQQVMNEVAGYNIHRGCLALGERPRGRPWRELADGAGCVVVLEGVGNADNVGSLFRNAAAFGAGAVLLGPACADPLYRKAIRTSMGAALAVPFAALEPWPAALRALRRTGVVTLGLTPHAGARPLVAVAKTIRGRRPALVLGHEGSGLSADAADACDHLARIPMAPGTDSLNVATAAAVALYELTKEESNSHLCHP